MADATERTVEVWYDARPGVPQGWVARCEDMDEPIGDEGTTADEARTLAAQQYGVSEDSVVVCGMEHAARNNVQSGLGQAE